MGPRGAGQATPRVEHVLRRLARGRACGRLDGPTAVRPSARHGIAHAPCDAPIAEPPLARLHVLREELLALCAHDDLKTAALLVLANKQDLPGAMTAVEITQQLGLHAISQHAWQVAAHISHAVPPVLVRA